MSPAVVHPDPGRDLLGDFFLAAEDVGYDPAGVWVLARFYGRAGPWVGEVAFWI
jgi:hypothetical protein